MSPKTKIDWDFISTWVFRVFMSGTAAGGIWAASLFAQKTDLDVYKPLPTRIERLEENDKRQEKKFEEQEVWRRTKDETDTKLTNLAEFQQQLLNRQQQMMDRQQAQIDDLNRRRP